MKQKRENFELKENNNNDLVQLEARSRMGYGVWNMDERFCAPKIVFRLFRYICFQMFGSGDSGGFATG